MNILALLLMIIFTYYWIKAKFEHDAKGGDDHETIYNN